MNYDICGVGNAIMDIQVQCDDAFLREQGIDKGVMTLVDGDRQQELLAALSGQQPYYCSGGSAANTVVGIAEMGGRCAYACLTGDDTHGRMYLDEMRRIGIAINTPPVAGGVTGSCVVLITPDAQRTMLTHLGVSAELTQNHLDSTEIARATYLYVEGYLFAGEATKGAALAAIATARAHGVKVALTLSDPFLIDIARTDFMSLLQDGAIDLLFCNEIEAKALTEERDPQQGARWLHRHVPSVAVTLGACGSLILDHGTLYDIPGVSADAVDTTGAGDMYAAGVLYGITHGYDWQRAGELGSRAAARIVARLGARLGTKEAQQLASA